MDYYILSPLLFILRMAEIFSQLTLSLMISNVKVSLKRFIIGSFSFGILFMVSSLIFSALSYWEQPAKNRRIIDNIVDNILFIF